MKGFRKVLRLWPWLAAIATGLACAACFAPFNHAWLCWLALTPLLSAIWFSGANAKRRWLRDLLLGYIAGLAFFWAVFSWLTTVTVLGWFLLQFYMAIYFAFWAWFAGILRPRARKTKTPAGLEAVTRRLEEKRATATSSRSGALLAAEEVDAAAGRAPLLAESPWLNSWSNLGRAFLLASAWVAHEWVRSWMFSGWGWNSLGSALHANLPVIQIAEFTGVAGLSFLAAFVNVIALTTARRLVVEAQARPTRAHYDLTLTMALLVAVFAWGVRTLQVHQPAQRLRVAAVQANIAREEKTNPAFTETIFDQFTRLSQMALRGPQRPDLLLWPESSLPAPVLQDEQTSRYVREFSAAAGTDLLMGSLDYEGNAAYNAALLVSDAGQHVQIYRKMHLVAFGEYIPGRHTMPLFAQIIGDQVPDDFAFGKEHTVFRLSKNDVQVAPLICFEDTIGELTRQFVLGGANLLANVTNDGWFRRSAGSQQHLANAVFRCVETRRPMVRSANTGVTCFVDEFGRVIQELRDDTGNQFTEGVLAGEVAVPTEARLTFYTRHGELFAQLCVCITLVVFVVTLPRLFRRRQVVSRAP